MRNPWLLFAVLCGGIMSIVLIASTAYGGGVGYDFWIIWKAARSAQPYTPDPYGPFVYPPTALLWIEPLRLLPFRVAYVLWLAASAGAFYWVTRKPLLFVSPIAIQGLVFGQPTLLLGSAVLSAAPIRGILIGLVISLKPQLLFMAPLVFLIRRDFKTVVGIVVGASCSFLASLIAFGLRPWADWIGALPQLRDVMVHRNLWWMTITPYGTAARFGLNPLPFWAAGAVLGCVTAVRSRADPLLVSALASVLVTPYAYAQDLIVLLPFCLEEAKRRDVFASMMFAGVLLPVTLVVKGVQSVLERDRLDSSTGCPSDRLT